MAGFSVLWEDLASELESKLVTVWKAFPWTGNRPCTSSCKKTKTKPVLYVTRTALWIQPAWIVQLSTFSFALDPESILKTQWEAFHHSAPWTQTFTPRANLIQTIHWPACFWKVGGNQRTFMIELGTLEDWGVNTTHCAAVPAQTHRLFLKLFNALSVRPFLFPLSDS